MDELPFEAVRAWLFEKALPLWSERGVDRDHGGFLEELSFAAEPTARPDKRVRTMCRQTYAFSHAALLGFGPGERLSTLGFEYLDAHARVEGGAWANLLARDGRIIDPRPDLYDLAFVMLALSWRYKLTGDEQVLQRLHATLDFITRSLKAGEGFLSIAPDDGERRQNPHMHFLEACLAAFGATQDQRFLDQARRLVALFERRFFNGRTLAECFAPDWSRLEPQTFEPGHHFEWAWLLAEFSKATATPLSPAAHALVDFGERVGVDRESGAVFDAVGEDGAPISRSSRAWTNTERIRGWLALHELTQRDSRAVVSQSLGLLFGRYFQGVMPGLWVDRFDGDGAALSSAAPASIVYHFLAAFSEVLRLEPMLRRDDTPGTS
ncbi:MAG: AGE family epimerase/isomerase [Hyphomonadaceae bacterium]|nr:AGE family epimerase/isomerase [Hyphomonadaceae bacterium]